MSQRAPKLLLHRLQLWCNTTSHLSGQWHSGYLSWKEEHISFKVHLYISVLLEDRVVVFQTFHPCLNGVTLSLPSQRLESSSELTYMTLQIHLTCREIEMSSEAVVTFKNVSSHFNCQDRSSLLNLSELPVGNDSLVRKMLLRPIQFYSKKTLQ